MGDNAVDFEEPILDPNNVPAATFTSSNGGLKLEHIAALARSNNSHYRNTNNKSYFNNNNVHSNDVYSNYDTTTYVISTTDTRDNISSGKYVEHDGNVNNSTFINNNVINSNLGTNHSQSEPITTTTTTKTTTTNTNKNSVDEANTFSNAYNSILIHTIAFLTNNIFLRVAGGRWAASTSERYILTGGVSYPLPLWYRDTRDFILNYWIHFMMVVLMAVTCYYFIPYFARIWISDEKNTGLVVCKIDFLSPKDVPLFLDLYKHKGQETYSDLFVDDRKLNYNNGNSPVDSDGLIGKGTPSGIQAGVDMDGNNLHDDIEELSMNIFVKDIISAETKQIHASSGGRSSIVQNDKTAVDNGIKLTPSPPINLPTNNVCGTLTQYEPSENLLRRRNGCFDIIAFMLHKKVNPTYLVRNIRKLLSDSGSQTVSRKYAASKMALDVSNANKEMENANRMEQKFRYSNRHTHCVCNTHMGFAEPFIYVGLNGEEPHMIIDPRLEPLSEVQARRIKDGIASARFIPSNSSGGLQETDSLLWTNLKYDSLLRQPYGINLSYKTLPPEDVMTEYYGSLLGNVARAYLNAHANQQQIKRLYENGIKMAKSSNTGNNSRSSSSTIVGVLNYIIHSIDSWTNPDAHELDAYHDIIKWRFDTQAIRAQQNVNIVSNKKNNGKMGENTIGGFAASAPRVKDNKNVAETILEFFNILNANFSSSSITTPPELVEVKNREFEGSTSGCIMHCMALHEATKIRRQEWRNALSGDESASNSMRSNKIEQLIFNFK